MSVAWRERARVGASCLIDRHKAVFGPLFRRTTSENVLGFQRGVVSSYAKGFVCGSGVPGGGFLRGLRDGAKSTIRGLCGQAPQRGAARRCGRFDDIDDADDIDDPRTEGRRRRVQTGSETPFRARKAEGGGCALRRRVVDVVDVVGSSKGRMSAIPGRLAILQALWQDFRPFRSFSPWTGAVWNDPSRQ